MADTKTRLTQKMLLERLRKVQDCSDDIEAAHADADELLLEYIGDNEITKAYMAIPKWYA